MSNFSTKKALSPARQELLQLMQRCDFCRIDLEVLDGEPVFRPRPHVVRDIKLGVDHGSRCELELDDFALRASVIDLFEQLNRIKSGKVTVIVRHGLPYQLLVELSVTEMMEQLASDVVEHSVLEAME